MTRKLYNQNQNPLNENWKELKLEIDQTVNGVSSSLLKSGHSATLFELTIMLTCPYNVEPLFSIFIDDLVREINRLNLGINVGSRKISILLYVDDIFILANSDTYTETKF